MATFTSAAEGAAILAQRCANARQHGDGWQASRPAHDDTTPSLSITPSGERILLHCHAGCDTAAIVAALGLQMRDLFAGAAPLPPPRRQAAPPPEAAPAPTPADPPQVVATYDYHDAQGTLLYQVQRWEPGRRGGSKDFSQRRPDGRGGWLNDLHGVPRVLWRLPAVRAAVRAGEPVYVVEGEKAVLALVALGLCATTKSGGALSRWEPRYSEALRGATVVILPDHDAPGRVCAQRASWRCRAGPAGAWRRGGVAGRWRGCRGTGRAGAGLPALGAECGSAGDACRRSG